MPSGFSIVFWCSAGGDGTREEAQGRGGTETKRRGRHETTVSCRSRGSLSVAS